MRCSDRAATIDELVRASGADEPLVRAQLAAVAPALLPPVEPRPRAALEGWARFDERFGILRRGARRGARVPAPLASRAMNITGVDFITVPTQDFEKADEFYGDVLGLERSKQWGSMPAREYETGSLTIAVMQSDAFGQRVPGRTRIRSRCTSTTWPPRARSSSRRASSSAPTRWTAASATWPIFSDPDGNALMFHHRYAPKDAKPTSV